jgi:hypothetical protein
MCSRRRQHGHMTGVAAVAGASAAAFCACRSDAAQKDECADTDRAKFSYHCSLVTYRRYAATQSVAMSAASPPTAPGPNRPYMRASTASSSSWQNTTTVGGTALGRGRVITNRGGNFRGTLIAPGVLAEGICHRRIKRPRTIAPRSWRHSRTGGATGRPWPDVRDGHQEATTAVLATKISAPRATPLPPPAGPPRSPAENFLAWAVFLKA